MTPRATAVFDSRVVAWVGICLISGYGWFLTSWLAAAYTLLGHTDFSVFWAAGRVAAAGQATTAYDVATIGELLKRASPGDPALPYLAMFFYPPWFLIVLAPLGSLAYATAAATWICGTLAIYLAAVRGILRGGTAQIAALAAPTVLLNVLMGQNGLLSAGLLGGALLLLDTAPVGAGILIGLLAYKPHFGLLLPLFLAITGRWRVFASAAATVAGLAIVAAALFGTDVFAAFARIIPAAGNGYLERGQLTLSPTMGPGWEAMASVYALLRAAGGNGAVAWCGHLAAAAAAGAGALWLAVSGTRSDLKAAGIATAVVVATPYSTYYDLAILTVAMAFVVRDGLSWRLRRSEWAGLAAAFLLPLLYIVSIIMLVPWRGTSLIGPLMCAILAAIIGRRAVAAGLRISFPPRPETAGAR